MKRKKTIWDLLLVLCVVLVLARITYKIWKNIEALEDARAAVQEARQRVAIDTVTVSKTFEDFWGYADRQ